MATLRVKTLSATPSLLAAKSHRALGLASVRYLATSDAPTSSRAAAPTSSSSPNTPSRNASASPPTPNSPVSLQRVPQKRMNFAIPSKIALPPTVDPLLSYFTNIIMQDGMRHRASRTVANMLNSIHALTHAPPLPILREAVERASPEVKVVSKKQRNKNVLTPRPLSAKQRTGQAIRWIVKISESRNERIFEHRLAKEIVAIMEDKSNVLKKKDEQHNLALANRANASVRL
ncbi:ribosomal protein S7 [Clavulina sp. PMI_390]|nr:ribosomal protein S7 [Clavulina sp. PMI_390]